MSRFCVIPSRVLDDDRFAISHLRVIAAIGTFTDKNGWCYPSIKKIAEKARLSRARVFACIKDLKEWGYIEVHCQYRPDNSQTVNRYRVLFDVGAPVDIPNQGDDDQENHGQLDSTPPSKKLDPRVNSRVDPPVQPRVDPVNVPLERPIKKEHVNDDVNNARAQKNENVVVDATPPLASQPKTAPPDPVTARAIEIAIMLRQRGAALQHSDPRVIAWAREGFSDAQLLTALETAQRQRAERNSTQPVNAGYLDAIVRENARAAATGKPSTASKERFDPLTYILSKRDSYKRMKEMENDPTLAGRIRRVAHSDGGFVCNFDIEIDGEDNDDQSVVDASLRA